jgi:hypothetical protein
MRARVTSWLMTVTLALSPLAASAEEQVKQYDDCAREPTEGDIAAAKGAFQAGQGSFNEADYPRAITYWEDALRRDCTANALLLNLARAYELYGQKRQAVVALQTYLTREPSSPQRDQINRRIEVLNSQIAAEQPAPQPTAPVPTAAPAPTAAPVAPPPQESTGGGGRPILPLIVAGVGGAVAIVGGVLYLNAASDVSAAEEACPDRRDCPPDITDDGNSAVSRQNIGGGLFIGGLAVAAAGTVWYFLSPAEGAAARSAHRPHVARRTTTWSPAIAPGFAGLGVSGSF